MGFRSPGSKAVMQFAKDITYAILLFGVGISGLILIMDGVEGVHQWAGLVGGFESWFRRIVVLLPAYLMEVFPIVVGLAVAMVCLRWTRTGRFLALELCGISPLGLCVFGALSVSILGAGIGVLDYSFGSRHNGLSGDSSWTSVVLGEEEGQVTDMVFVAPHLSIRGGEDATAFAHIVEGRLAELVFWTEAGVNRTTVDDGVPPLETSWMKEWIDGSGLPNTLEGPQVMVGLGICILWISSGCFVPIALALTRWKGASGVWWTLGVALLWRVLYDTGHSGAVAGMWSDLWGLGTVFVLLGLGVFTACRWLSRFGVVRATPL